MPGTYKFLITMKFLPYLFLSFTYSLSSRSLFFYFTLFCFFLWLQLVLLLSALLGKEKFFEDHCNPSSSTSSSTADKKSKRDRESDEVCLKNNMLNSDHKFSVRFSCLRL